MESRPYMYFFLVKSRYVGLINRNIHNLNRRLWKLKTSFKIKIFLGYLRRGVILTKDDLAKWNWQENQQCCFYHEIEMIHLFSGCVLQEWHVLQCMRPEDYPSLTVCPLCMGVS